MQALFGMLMHLICLIQSCQCFLKIDGKDVLSLMHVIEHDISLTLDIIFMFRRYEKISPLLKLNY